MICPRLPRARASFIAHTPGNPVVFGNVIGIRPQRQYRNPMTRLACLWRLRGHQRPRGETRGRMFPGAWLVHAGLRIDCPTLPAPTTAFAYRRSQSLVGQRRCVAHFTSGLAVDEVMPTPGP
jgi:hypothetical protein